MDQPVIRIAASEEDVLKTMVVRGIVFIEEQEVDWEGEIDEFEDSSVHILAEWDGQPAGAARLRLLEDGWAKLERIAVRPRWRGRGLARGLTAFLVEEAARRGATRLKLHAQSYLEEFYAGYGFRRQGANFDECGIDHVLMVRGED